MSQTKIAIMNPTDPIALSESRRRPTVSRSLQELDLQSLKRAARLDAGLKMEMAFSLSMALNDLFRAGMRSRGLGEEEIERLFNSVRR